MATSRKVIEWVFEVKGNATAETARLADGIEHVRTAAGKSGVGKLGEELDSLGRMIGKVPVPGFQQLGDVMGAAGDSMGALANPIGASIIAIGGFGAAVGATTAAIVSLVMAADEWLEALRDAGRSTDFISPEELRQLESANEAIAGLGLELKETGVILAAQFSDDVGYAAEVLAGLVIVVNDFASAVSDSRLWDGLEVIRVSILQIISGGAFGHLRLATEALAGLSGELVKLERLEPMSGEEMMASLGFDAVGDFVDGGAAAKVREFYAEAKRRREEAKRDAEQAAQAEDRRVAAMEKLVLATQKATATDPWQQLLAAQSGQLAFFRGLAEEAGNTADALNRVAEVEAAQASERADAFARGVDLAIPTEGIAKALADIDVPTNAEIDASMAKVEEALKSEIRQTKMDAAVSGVSDVVGALQGGLGGILTALGPAGAIAGTILQVLPELSTIIDGVIAESMSLVRELPGILETLLRDTLPDLLIALPDLVSEIVRSIDDIVAALLAAGPEMALAFATLPYRMAIEFWKAIPHLVEQMGREIAELFASWWDSIKEFFSTLFKGDKDKTTGTNLLDGRFAGFDLSPQDQGWFGLLRPNDVASAGASRASAGASAREAADMAMARSSAAVGRSVTVHVGTIVGNAEESVRQITEIMRRQQGAFGLGTSLDPLGG